MKFIINYLLGKDVKVDRLYFKNSVFANEAGPLHSKGDIIRQGGMFHNVFIDKHIPYLLFTRSNKGVKVTLK